MGLIIDKISGNPLLIDIKEADLDTALKAKVNQGKVAGIITTTLPSTGIVTDKVYEFAGVQGVPITGGTIKDTNGATITTLQNGDSLWYNTATEFWYRIPFQSLANYPLISEVKSGLSTMSDFNLVIQKSYNNDPVDTENTATQLNNILSSQSGGSGHVLIETLGSYFNGWHSFIGKANTTGTIANVTTEDANHHKSDVIIKDNLLPLNVSGEIEINIRHWLSDSHLDNESIFSRIWLNKVGTTNPSHSYFLFSKTVTNKRKFILYINGSEKSILNGSVVVENVSGGNLLLSSQIKKIIIKYNYQLLQLQVLYYEGETFISLCTWQLTLSEWNNLDLDSDGTTHLGNKFIRLHTYYSNVYINQINFNSITLTTDKFKNNIKEIISSDYSINREIPTTIANGALNNITEPENNLIVKLPIPASNFNLKTLKINHKYQGKLTPNKRYLICGFDDFRDTDVNWVSPLFAKYGFRCTFNKINYGEPTQGDINNMYNVLMNGHEVGDHTIMHQMLVYYSPYFNGQNPNSLEGTQTEFPTNNDMRNNRGDGKNVFGKTLTSLCSDTFGSYVVVPAGTTWATLSDANCQTIRDEFSVMKNSTLISYLDSLSNEFIGTTGNSLNSFVTDKYTGGIFTNCKTSENHEIWERICIIQKAWFKKYFGLNQDITEWSLPGSKNSYLYFEDSGLFYFDREKTQLANDYAKLTSSLVKDFEGNYISRSWTDVLRNYGYKHCHDAMYPGQRDGTTIREAKRTYIVNANISKKDGLPFPTGANRDVAYPSQLYNEAYFAGSTNWMQKMYEDTFLNQFRNSIENLRHLTAQGKIAENVCDSEDTFQMKIFYEMILKFCHSSGIEVITKSEAFDICHNHYLYEGNLVYNPNFINTAKIIIPNASNHLETPDGWSGDCLVLEGNTAPDGYSNILKVVSGSLVNKHYGVPLGKLKYSFYAKGNGSVSVFYLRNKEILNALPSNSEKVNTDITITESSFTEKTIEFYVKDEPIISSSLPLDGMDNKICGIYILVTGNDLQITMPKLYLI